MLPWVICAPVVLSADKEEVISHAIPSSPIWLKFNRKTLRKNTRLQQSQDLLTEVSTTEQRTAAQSQLNYGNMLLAIGDGTYMPNVTNKEYMNDATRGSKIVQLTWSRSIINIENALSFVFPPPFHPESLCNRPILAVTNKDVDNWNKEVQKQNLFPLTSLASHDELAECDDPHNILRNMLTDDVLNNFNKNGVPPHILNLKINDTCIVLRNLNKREGLTNNTRVRVIAITPKCVRVQTIGINKKLFSVSRIRFKFLLPFGRSFQLLRTQLPLRLAYCISINKAQDNINGIRY